MSLTMQVGGRELLLRWTVPAWLELEKQVGNIKTMWGDISTGKMPMTNQLRLAVAMANAGAKYRGEKGGVTLEWLAENLTHAQAIEIGRLAVRGYEIAMHREHAEDDDEEAMVDAVLEEEQKKNARGITARECIAYGLIAGLPYEEIMRQPPGLILDLYTLKRQYDDEQHGIKRKSRCAWEE